jgi:protein arginine N-methyltransferase 2
MAAVNVCTSSENSAPATILVALGDYNATDSNQLSFKHGDRFKLLDDASEHWWWCELRGREKKQSKGYVPVNHVVTLEQWEVQEAERWQDDEYFDSYGHLKLHLEMLEDQPRTTAYMKAVQLGAGFLQDKVVLDVGCGTGILSMFCARNGNARKVYAVEASKLAVHTEEVVKCNGLEDQVKVIHGKIEDIDLPEKVDVIISEWMGTLLLFELMLESVLSARNRFLKQGGVMWPSEAHLFLVPCTAQLEYDRKLAFWECQYGFDFSPLMCVFRKIFDIHSMYNNTCILQTSG